jgi:hypothetical protein
MLGYFDKLFALMYNLIRFLTMMGNFDKVFLIDKNF